MNEKSLPFEITERDTHLGNYLINKLSKYVEPSASDILEIGIGKGKFGLLLANSVSRYFGIDIDKEQVEIAKSDPRRGENVTYKAGNAENIPFARQFDVIFYSKSWHFIKNPQKALEEAKRVLHPDGIIAILEPTEKTTNWSSPKLIRGSPEFDETYLKQKLEKLKRGRQAILEQRLFKDIIEEYNADTTLNLYILTQSY